MDKEQMEFIDSGQPRHQLRNKTTIASNSSSYETATSHANLPAIVGCMAIPFPLPSNHSHSHSHPFPFQHCIFIPIFPSPLFPFLSIPVPISGSDYTLKARNMYIVSWIQNKIWR